MAYEPPTSTIKVGDIFTNELIAKINEILLDSKSTIGEQKIRGHFDIQIIDNQSKIYRFVFGFNFRQPEDTPPNNIKQLGYYKSFEKYNREDETPTYIIPVDDNFQINADIEMIYKEEPKQDDRQ